MTQTRIISGIGISIPRYGKYISPSPPPLPQDFDILSENENEITFWYDGDWVTYGIVNGQTGTKWMDRNLGASRVAQGIDDELAYGDVYQWGRFKDGHEKRNSETTFIISTSDTPEHGGFIINTDSTTYKDWRTPQNSELWQPNTRTNIIAPNGWRIPTYPEFLAERDSWAFPKSEDAFWSDLKLPSPGGRENNGNFGGMGNSGAYWTSTLGGTNSGALNFSITGLNLMSSIFRAFVLPIRLIKDQKFYETTEDGKVLITEDNKIIIKE